jgi:hypothetical protein
LPISWRIWFSFQPCVSAIVENDLRPDIGMPISPAMSASQASVSRSISIVREALVTSVTCTPPPAPPVRFHSNHVSTVPNTASPWSAAARTPSTLSRIHWALAAEKYVAGGRPAFRRMTSP